MRTSFSDKWHLDVLIKWTPRCPHNKDVLIKRIPKCPHFKDVQPDDFTHDDEFKGFIFAADSFKSKQVVYLNGERVV